MPEERTPVHMYCHNTTGILQSIIKACLNAISKNATSNANEKAPENWRAIFLVVMLRKGYGKAMLRKGL